MLAGDPFRVSPTELMAMTGQELVFWVERASNRIKKESAK